MLHTCLISYANALVNTQKTNVLNPISNVAHLSTDIFKNPVRTSQ
jgi:hypothetical protein